MEIRKNIFTNSKLFILLHILAWGIIFLIPHYIISTYGDGNMHFLMHLYVNISLYGILFYANYLLFIPRLLLNDRKTSYYFISLLFLVLVCLGIWYINEFLLFDQLRAEQMQKMFEWMNKEKPMMKPPIRQLKALSYFSTSLFVWGFSLGLRLVEKVNQDEKRKKEMEKEKLDSELAFLKNQISPHFFFNTLNNIYSLIAIDTDIAQESVLKLSKLMRYLLYESEKGETKLREEITFLNNYIDLMKLRLNDKVALTVTIPQTYTNHTVPPLLFVPFLENAFKHGISYREHSYISVRMDISEDQIEFCTQNSIAAGRDITPEIHSGIGLENVKKRLNLLFPGAHRLTIEATDDTFKVELLLNLKTEHEKN